MSEGQIVQLAAQSDDAIWAAAAPLMDNLMDASTRIDRARHILLNAKPRRANP